MRPCTPARPPAAVPGTALVPGTRVPACAPAVPRTRVPACAPAVPRTRVPACAPAVPGTPGRWLTPRRWSRDHRGEGVGAWLSSSLGPGPALEVGPRSNRLLPKDPDDRRVPIPIAHRSGAGDHRRGPGGPHRRVRTERRSGSHLARSSRPTDVVGGISSDSGARRVEIRHRGAPLLHQGSRRSKHLWHEILRRRRVPVARPAELASTTAASSTTTRSRPPTPCATSASSKRCAASARTCGCGSDRPLTRPRSRDGRRLTLRVAPVPHLLQDLHREGLGCSRPTELQADFAAQRIKNLSLFEGRHQRAQPPPRSRRPITSLIEEFEYPQARSRA